MNETDLSAGESEKCPCSLTNKKKRTFICQASRLNYTRILPTCWCDISLYYDGISDCCHHVETKQQVDTSVTLKSMSTSTHQHQSLNREGRWGTTHDFATSFLHFSLFSSALWDLPNSRPVHSLMLSSHLFLSLPCLNDVPVSYTHLRAHET